MHTGITINFFIQNDFGDKKYVYQYLKYCTTNTKLFDFYFLIFGNLTNDLKVF